MPNSVLIVDDEKNIRLMAATVLNKQGFRATAVASAADAMKELGTNEFGVILVDYMMPEIDGLALLKQVREKVENPPPAVFMTAYGSVETAVAAMRAGAVDFISKPFTSDELVLVVERNMRAQRLEREVADLRRKVDAADAATSAGIVAESPSMKQLLSTAEQVAASKAPVLIEGETGTGKERLARLIHDRSPRAKAPFIAVNCGALHPELLLSELFGHKRGSFTGAVEDRVGLFEAADGGTLFLDEVGELDAGAQVKLLRVLQEESFERIGDTRTINVDVRIVAATNRRLEEMVAEESFRADLYFRLAVITLRIPPLRERLPDLMPLATSFLAEFAAETGRNLAWPAETAQTLASARWPGNIRELRNAIQRAVLLTPQSSETVALNQLAAGANQSGNEAQLLAAAASEQWSLQDLEREYLKILLARSDLKLGDICEILQIDASTLWRKRKKYHI